MADTESFGPRIHTLQQHLQWHTGVANAWEGHEATADPWRVSEPDTRCGFDARRDSKFGAALCILHNPYAVHGVRLDKAFAIIQRGAALATIRLQ